MSSVFRPRGGFKQGIGSGKTGIRNIHSVSKRGSFVRTLCSVICEPVVSSLGRNNGEQQEGCLLVSRRNSRSMELKFGFCRGSKGSVNLILSGGNEHSEKAVRDFLGLLSEAFVDTFGIANLRKFRLVLSIVPQNPDSGISLASGQNPEQQFIRCIRAIFLSSTQAAQVLQVARFTLVSVSDSEVVLQFNEPSAAAVR